MRGAMPRPVVGRDWRRVEDAAWRTAAGGRMGEEVGGR